MAVAPAGAEEVRNMASPVLVEDLNPTLSKAVKYQLGSVPGLDNPDIQVVSDEGTVKLIGKVGSDRLRERADRIARDVPGVNRVINDLWVRDLVNDGRLPWGSQGH